MSPRIRVFLDFPTAVTPLGGEEIEIFDPTAHHLRDVLRVTQGTALTAVCRATGQEYEAVVSHISKKELKIKILQSLKPTNCSNPVASVFTALLKGSKNDLVCEKATELGVTNIVFWGAARSTLKIHDETQAAAKLKRWTAIAESAARQSARAEIPHVRLCPSLSSLLNLISEISSPNERLLALSLSEKAKELKDLNPLTTKAHLLIGPEGDLTNEEENKLIEHGFELVRLGPYILRSETAAIVGIAMAQAISKV